MTKVQNIYQQELDQALKDHEKMLRAYFSGDIKEYTLNLAQKLINAKELSLPPEKIAEVTGLTVEEIIRLKK